MLNVELNHYYPHIAEPSSSPRLAVVAVTETSAVFAWQPLTCWERNGVTLNYRLIVEKLVLSRPSKSLVGYAKGTETSHAVHNLERSTKYSAHIAAMNEIGRGPFSEAVTFTTK